MDARPASPDVPSPQDIGYHDPRRYKALGLRRRRDVLGLGRDRLV